MKITERGFPQHAFPCLLHCFLLSSGSFSHLSFSIFECAPSSGFSRDVRSLIYSCRKDESNGAAPPVLEELDNACGVRSVLIYKLMT